MQVLFQLFVSEFGRVWAGLIDAAAARSQLGFTSTGSAVATAVDAPAARTAIGLGTMATQNANAVAITGGTGAFTGPISTADTTESTSTTTGSIRGAGAGFTGNLYVGGLTSIQGVTLEKINSLLYTPTQKRGIVTNDLSLSLGAIGVGIGHPSPGSVVGRFDFFHTAGDQGILVEGGGNVRGWMFYVLQDDLWWHAGDAGATGDIPGRFEGSTLIEPGLNTVEFYFSVSQESRVFLNGRLVDQKQITMTSNINFGADNMYLWGSSVPPGSWPVNYLPPELVTSYPIGSKGLFAYAFDLSLDLLPAVDPAAARTAIGLGTMATQNANAVAITGGSGAFTGPISTADTTESTSTTTGSIRGAGAGFTGQVSAADFLKSNLFGNYGLTSVAKANQTFHVSTTGNDNNSGTAGSPFATIQKAVNVVASVYWGEYVPVIQVADGTYVQSRVLLSRVFAPRVEIRGNSGNPQNVVFDCSGTTGAGGRCFENVDTFSRYIIDGFTVSANVSQQCFYLSGPCATVLRNIRFGSGTIKVLALSTTLLFAATKSIFVEQANNVFLRAEASSVNFGSLQIELSQNTQFNSFLQIVYGSTINLANVTVTGGQLTGNSLAATGSYLLNLNNSSLVFGNVSAVNCFAFGSAAPSISFVADQITFADGSTLAPNANGDLVFTSKNNNSTTMALA